LGLVISDSKIYSVQCNSDINVWSQDSEFPVTTLRGHQNNITKIVNFNDKLLISADQDGRLLSWNPDTFEASRAQGIYKLPIQVQALACNSSFVYAASGDMNVLQFSVDYNGLSSVGELKKKHSSVLQFIATESMVYALFTDKSIHILKADDVHQTVAENKTAGDIVGMALAGSQLWVADSKGFVHILNADTLKPEEGDELKTVYGHPALSVASSADGSLVAVGDTKGYVTVFDAASRSQKSYFALHQNKVIEIHFTQDNRVATLGFDKLLCIGNLENSQGTKLSCPNGVAMTNSFCLFKDCVMTAGYDCAIRKYKY
jgi:WD40 repeat protein